MEPNDFFSSFVSLKDPRIDRGKKHKLLDIIGLALVGVICDCDTWEEIEDFGNHYFEDLKKYFSFTNGVPSHDTINRVFSKIDPKPFQGCLLDWLNSIRKFNGKDLISIDGKEMRSSSLKKKNNLGFVQAWSKKRSIVLGSIGCNKGGGEVPKIPELLELLNLTDCLVTVDAGNARSSVANAIINRGGDYLMTIKKNEGSLYNKLESIFAGNLPEEIKNFNEFEAMEHGHGRMDYKYCVTIESDDFEHLDLLERWPEMKTIGMIQGLRLEDSSDDGAEARTRFFISSSKLSGEDLYESARGHWAIENNLHWVLDVAFNEDNDRKKDRTSASNIAMLRRFAVSIMKKKKEEIKVSYNRLRKKCHMDVKLLGDVILGT